MVTGLNDATALSPPQRKKIGQLTVKKIVIYENRTEGSVYSCKVKVGDQYMGDEVYQAFVV
jgi:hypothetical protein